MKNKLKLIFAMLFLWPVSLMAQVSIDSVNIYLKNGKTQLIEAVSADNFTHVKKLLKNGADPNQMEKSSLGGTPLMYATATKNLAMCKALVGAGAKVNAVDKNNDPALNWATYYGHTAIMNFLIKIGADLSITSKHGTSVDVALRLWHGDSVQQVFRSTSFNEKRTSLEKKLIKAVRENDWPIVKKLLKSGISASTTDGLKTPVLQLAAQEGFLDIVKALIEAGTDINQLNRVGQCALTFAARFGHMEIVDYLLAKGCDPNATGNAYKLTPLMGAGVGGDAAIGKHLINAGARINDIDIVNECGALHFAMFYANSDFIKMMLTEGADYTSEVLDKSYTGYSLAKAYKYKEVTDLMTEMEVASNPMLGSWKITRIDYIYTDTTYTLERPFPGRLLVTPWRYSIIYNPWNTERTPFGILSKPTNDEIKMAFQTLVFNTGTYQMKEGVFITTADIAKVPGFEGGVQHYEFNIDEDQLIYRMVDETYPDGTKPAWYGKLEVQFTMTKE